MKDRLAVILALTVMIIILPYIITLFINGCGNRNKSVLKNVSSGRDVILTENGKNRLIDVEEYIAMSLPSLIDWKSDMELIEAQAVAVRGKILYQMGEDTVINANELEFVYFTDQDLIDKYGRDNYKQAKVVYEKAVYNTLGQGM
ncbi:MAG: SpoIID/LytB domain-containing protein [Lachnospiraceae bacterium]|nr:SpoIID/LytB domain-containing protein [Lachnospiraceae bacterium]